MPDFNENLEPQKKEQQNSFFKQFFIEFFSFLKLFVIAFVAAYVITHFIIINAEVPTGSMTNTIMEHDRIIGLRLTYLFKSPQRGDIVIFKYPDDEKQNFVKRVIGVPGDIVEITGGKVYINNEEIYEPYIREAMDVESDMTFIVPTDSYFVMGDNRNNSLDSRYWRTSNYVKKNKILAKSYFKYFNMAEKRIDFTLLK